MGNMSYCRYQNTLGDLRDCQDALEEDLLEEDKLSKDEHRAMLALIRRCQQIADDYGYVVEE